MLPKALDVSAVLPVPFGSAVDALHPDLAVGVDASWVDPAVVASKNGMKKTLYTNMGCQKRRSAAANQLPLLRFLEV